MTNVVVHSDLNYDTRLEVSEKARELIRAGFNPSESPKVDLIKTLAAALVQVCEDIRMENPNAERHASLAITDVEKAAMWAVKAATTPAPTT